MAINDVYHVPAESVAPDESLVVSGSDAETGAAEVFEIGGDVDVTVYRETDVDGDETYEVSVLIDAFSSPFHSQKNQIVVSDSNNQRLRLQNESAEAGSLYATGLEVND